MADASGTNGLHGTANTYNWIQSGLLTQSLNSDQGNHMTLFEALTHTVEVCKIATSAWTNTPFTAQTGSPTVKFNATPAGNGINAVVGLSNGPQSIYTGLAAIVRFNPSGFIDAYPDWCELRVPAERPHPQQCDISRGSRLGSDLQLQPAVGRQLIGSAFL
ncbi:MAG: uncharacterized protein JWO04_141 [Gammaproteobacteria bacterium]|nr:uncharacterized protein [Gammaproteobacteria bacterium]